MELTNYATIQQQSRHPSKTSEQYRFISTSEVLGHFADAGWFPSTVREKGYRKPENRGFQEHIVRLRSSEFDRASINVGDAFPEIVLKSSHNGTCSLHFYAGLMEKVCSNGLIIQTEKMHFASIPHRGYTALLAGAMARHFGRVLVEGFEQRERWRGIRLQRDEQLAFADAAIALRFDRDAVEVDPKEVLMPRRYEQSEPTLWNVFNSLQENIMRGGVSQVRSDGRRARSRAVKNIDEDLRINRELWRLAQELEKAVQH